MFCLPASICRERPRNDRYGNRRYSCICMLSNFNRVWINCQSCSWSAAQRNIFSSLYPFAPEKLVSRDGFGCCAVPRQPAHSPYSGWIWCLLTRFPPLSATTALTLHDTSSTAAIGPVPIRVYRVTQLTVCTSGVHCRESTGTGPVVVKRY